MSGQQLRQAPVTIRRTFSPPARRFSLAAALVFLVLAAVLTLGRPASVTQVAPAASPAARPTAWTIGTGSVHDGGAYGVLPAARPTAWAIGTGSVYDGR